MKPWVWLPTLPSKRDSVVESSIYLPRIYSIPLTFHLFLINTTLIMFRALFYVFLSQNTWARPRGRLDFEKLAILKREPTERVCSPPSEHSWAYANFGSIENTLLSMWERAQTKDNGFWWEVMNMDSSKHQRTLQTTVIQDLLFYETSVYPSIHPSSYLSLTYLLTYLPTFNEATELGHL